MFRAAVNLHLRLAVRSTCGDKSAYQSAKGFARRREASRRGVFGLAHGAWCASHPLHFDGD